MTRLLSILALLIAASSIYAAVVISRRSGFPAAGLVSYWRLNEASGSALDAQGSNDLTDVNTVGSAAGKLGDARQFVDTSGEELTITDAAQTGLDFTGDWSFSVWVYFDALDTNNELIFTKWDGPGGEREYLLRITSNGDATQPSAAMLWVTNDGTLTGDADLHHGTTLVNATWYCIQGYFDSGTEIALRVNGGAWATLATTATPYSGAAVFSIGGAEAGWGTDVNFMDGRIDDLGLWSRMLTTQEFDDLYASGDGLPLP